MPTDLFTLTRRRYVARRKLARRTVRSVRAAWKRMDPTAIRYSWLADVGPSVLAVVEQAQFDAASTADATVAAMLAAQGISEQDPAALIDPAAFAGVASDGRNLVSLLELANLQALRLISRGAKPAVALAQGGQWLELVAGVQVSDAARVAGGVAITSRRQVDGFYRQLSPPSCSRCIVLAGRWYRWDAGFERHPKCDCGEIGANDGALDEAPKLWTPQKAFEALSPAQQDRTFTAAGAQAIRDGADLSQVVNVRSGMATASVGGRDVLITTSGTTKHGYFAYVQRAIDRERGRATSYRSQDVGRRGYIRNYNQRRVARPRLMPEQIYRIANGNRDEAIRLLAGNGYLVQGVATDAARALLF